MRKKKILYVICWGFNEAKYHCILKCQIQVLG